MSIECIAPSQLLQLLCLIVRVTSFVKKFGGQSKSDVQLFSPGLTNICGGVLGAGTTRFLVCVCDLCP